MGYGYVGRRRRPQPVPGDRCPATRGSRVYDDAVTQRRWINPYAQEGRRTCGRCGREGVRVTQSGDDYVPMNAWVYDPHTVPEEMR